jgi:hypothetical protein
VQQLTALTWPGAVQAVRWQALATGELLAQQPTLFAITDGRPAALDAVAEGLTGRYAAALWRSQVVDPGHPVAERRSHFHTLTAA